MKYDIALMLIWLAVMLLSGAALYGTYTFLAMAVERWID